MKTISKKNIQKNAVKMNEIALDTTEKAVTISIQKIEALQKVTSKSIKKTLDFSEHQQEQLFNRLEKNKAIVAKKVQKAFAFFIKN